MNHGPASSRNILACLGDSSRFRLVLSLLERERCVTELAAEVGLSQSCTTRHLQYLEREGLVRGDRQGKRVVFHLRFDRARVRELMAWVTAAPPEPGRISGADVHADGDGTRKGPQADSRRARAPRRAAPRDAARPRASEAPPIVLSTAVEPADPPAPPAAQDGNDMEDWLL
jgi:ArsR family transcriptional regulator